ncbi:hypothetical protein [uncultured Draconibacterium sp.]|uniref:hypothetical protein n=1 Tax=uncultured Draconibacterium sp. TaxID=1573823 RepID=UPI00325FF1A6
MIYLKYLVLVICLLTVNISVFAKEAPSTFKNPIVPGFHSDSSIRRVGDTFVEGVLLDKNNEIIAGAYYVYVTKLK